MRKKKTSAQLQESAKVATLAPVFRLLHLATDGPGLHRADVREVLRAVAQQGDVVGQHVHGARHGEAAYAMIKLRPWRSSIRLRNVAKIEIYRKKTRYYRVFILNWENPGINYKVLYIRNHMRYLSEIFRAAL